MYCAESRMLVCTALEIVNTENFKLVVAISSLFVSGIRLYENFFVRLWCSYWGSKYFELLFNC